LTRTARRARAQLAPDGIPFRRHRADRLPRHYDLRAARDAGQREPAVIV